LKYTLLNRMLAILEHIILNDDVDRMIDRVALIDEIKYKLAPFRKNIKVDDSPLVDLIIQAIKTDEFKEVLKTDEFQKVYNITNDLSLGFINQLTQLINDDIWLKVSRTSAWKSFLALDIIHQILAIFASFDKNAEILYADVIIHDLPRISRRIVRFDFIAEENKIIIKFEPSHKKAIIFNLLDKEFEVDISAYSPKKIREHLKKSIIDDNEKSKIIEATIESSQEFSQWVTQTDKDPEDRFIALVFLNEFIFGFEDLMINYFIEQRNQNSHFYQSLISQNPNFHIDVDLLFICMATANCPMIIDTAYSDFSDFWQLYSNSLLEEEKRADVKLRQKQFIEAYQKLGDTLNIPADPAQAVAPKVEKKKLPCFNYLYAALLHEKARKSDDEFVRLCREAAGQFIDRNGNEFTGEQLANVFHNTVKKYGGWPEFYEMKKQSIKILKKKINWQE